MLADLPLADLRGYRPDVAEPADFDRFWTDQLTAARAHRAEPAFTLTDSPVQHAQVYDVTFPGHGGNPIGGWLLGMRNMMVATLSDDYVVAAEAKGLRPARILLVHALKPSSLTLVTVTGINIGRLIGGALIVEVIFALPGIGRLLVGAIYARDFIILQGAVLFVAVGFVMVNFIVDMLYAVLDPRIRHGRA